MSFIFGKEKTGTSTEKTPFCDINDVRDKLNSGEPLSLAEAVYYAYTVSNTSEKGRYQGLWEPADDDQSPYAYPIHGRFSEIVDAGLQRDDEIERKLAVTTKRRDYPSETEKPLRDHLVDVLNNRFQVMQKFGTTDIHTKHQSSLKKTISETLGSIPVNAKRMPL